MAATKQNSQVFVFSNLNINDFRSNKFILQQKNTCALFLFAEQFLEKSMHAEMSLLIMYNLTFIVSKG